MYKKHIHFLLQTTTPESY
uniref:Uncharacterized protein n=1 Tax=Anguilla anguilla TaxID=7936 RepID=A0A0E9PPU5_ANGAN